MQSKLEQARLLLDEAFLLLRYPNNGRILCFWCAEQRQSGCSPNCWYVEHTKAIDSYREKVKAYLASLP